MRLLQRLGVGRTGESWGPAEASDRLEVAEPALAAEPEPRVESDPPVATEPTLLAATEPPATPEAPVPTLRPNGPDAVPRPASPEPMAPAQEPLPAEILAVMRHLEESAAREPDPFPPPAVEPEVVEPPPPAPDLAGIQGAAGIAGLLGAGLADEASGALLAAEGGRDAHPAAEAPLHAQVLRAQRQAVAALGIEERIEDILVTLGQRLHVLRPLGRQPSAFLFVTLDRRAANLGLARMQIAAIERGLGP